MGDLLDNKPSTSLAAGNRRVGEFHSHATKNKTCEQDIAEVPLHSYPTPRNWADAPVFVPRSLKLPAMEFDPVSEGSAQLDAFNAIDGSEIKGLPSLQVLKAPPTVYSLETLEEASTKKTWAEFDAHGNKIKINSGAIPRIVRDTQEPKPSKVWACRGCCPKASNCCYQLHLQMCHICGEYVLDPSDAGKRRAHTELCQQRKLAQEEHNRCIARSKGKICGICLDVVLDKDRSQRRFGILPNCSHIFCLACIRKWRETDNFHFTITRSCPLCRVKSDFVIPSTFWVESEEDKKTLLQQFRRSTSMKHCKYFRRGAGVCPFGNKCFYKHALLTGELVEVGHPTRRRVINSANDMHNMTDVNPWDLDQMRELFFQN